MWLKVSYRLAYLPLDMSVALKLIQDCGISLLRFCNVYLQKFNPPLILDFGNGSRNRLKIKCNIVLKAQILQALLFTCGHKLRFQIRVSYCYCCFQMNEYNSKKQGIIQITLSLLNIYPRDKLGIKLKAKHFKCATRY